MSFLSKGDGDGFVLAPMKNRRITNWERSQIPQMTNNTVLICMPRELKIGAVAETVVERDGSDCQNCEEGGCEEYVHYEPLFVHL